MLGMGECSQQPCPGAQPFPGRAEEAWEHGAMRPHEEDLMRPLAATYTPASSRKKLLSSFGSRPPRTKSFPRHAGGSVAAPLHQLLCSLQQRQAAVLAQALCVPTVPLGLCSMAGGLQLPSLLQMVQVGFGSCVSWRKRQTEHLTRANWRRKRPTRSPCAVQSTLPSHPPTELILTEK